MAQLLDIFETFSPKELSIFSSFQISLKELPEFPSKEPQICLKELSKITNISKISQALRFRSKDFD